MARDKGDNGRVEIPSKYEIDLDTIGPAAVVAKLCAILGPDGVKKAAKTEGSEVYGYPAKYIKAGIENYKILRGIDGSYPAMLIRDVLSGVEGSSKPSSEISNATPGLPKEQTKLPPELVQPTTKAPSRPKLPSGHVRPTSRQSMERTKLSSEQLPAEGRLPAGKIKVTPKKAKISRRSSEGMASVEKELKGLEKEKGVERSSSTGKRKLAKEEKIKRPKWGQGQAEGPLFPNLNWNSSDWVDLTTNGALQYNHQTGEIRESVTMAVRGQLPTYEVGSKEFEELAAEEPEPKPAHSKNRPGPRNVTWQLVPGSDRLPAVRGKPDASKFAIIRQSKNRTPQATETLSFEHVVGFDWDDQLSVTKLNKWRQQTIRRFEGTLVHERRLPWSAMEHQRLAELMQNALQANGNNRAMLDWEAMARNFNNSFKDLVQKKGDPLARPISSHKKTAGGTLSGELCDASVIDHDRISSNRDANGLRSQARRFPDTLKMLNDAQKPRSAKTKATKQVTAEDPGATEEEGDPEEGEAKNPAEDSEHLEADMYDANLYANLYDANIYDADD